MSLVPIEAIEIDKINERLTLADRLAEYITDAEAEDFYEWCREELRAETDADFFTLDERHMNHIFGVAKLFLHHSGFDIAPYCFTTEFLESQVKL